uniref:Retrovirus-related Pol polyprotein from transposon TNT 1-94 n=1 Tax=Rhizophora mucronata TaxID=61149 RepID=A0A2P2J1R8_RHIMU
MSYNHLSLLKIILSMLLVDVTCFSGIIVGSHLINIHQTFRIRRANI